MALPVPINMRAGGVNRDYATIFADLKRLIPQVIPEWTYLNEDDFGIAMLQLVSYAADHINYRADITLRELSLILTQYRRIAVARAQWLGYRASRPTSASASLNLQIPSAYGFDVPIDARQQFSAVVGGNTVIFETVNPFTILAGETTVTGVAVVEGQTQLDTILGTAAGTPFEFFTLPANTIFNHNEGELIVQVGADAFTLVSDPTDATPSDLIFWVRQNDDKTLRLMFGDGTYGALLVPGAQVQATYRIGGGPIGRVPANAITTQVSTIIAPDLSSVAFSPITNPISSAGGFSEETLESIKLNAPAFYKAQNRAVTLTDYETFASQSQFVHRVKAVHAGVNGINLYTVVAGADTGSNLTPLITSDVLQQLEDVKMATDVLAVLEATLVDINIEVEVVAFPNFRNAVIESACIAAISDPSTGFLSFNLSQLSDDLSLSDLVNILEDVEGLDYLEPIQFTREPQFTFIRSSGNATYDATKTALTAAAVTQTFTLFFQSAVTYTVNGSVTGLQVNQGTLGALYTTDDGSVSFQLDAGGTPMSASDSASLLVAETLAWRLNLGSKEFPVAGNVTINVTGGID